MANPSKKKGTGGETELLRLFEEHGFLDFVRTSPGMNHDLARPGHNIDANIVQVLATRPDRGQWLVTLRLKDFLGLLQGDDLFLEPHDRGVQVEVKRYARFALHTIFEGKFGNK